MHSLVCGVATYAVNAVWQVPLIAAAGWMASRMLGRLGPRAQHVAWVATLVVSIGLPSVAAARMLAGGAAADAGPLAGFSVAMGTGAVAGAAEVGGVLLPAWAVTGIFVLYGLTVVVASLRLLWLLRRTARLVGESEPVALDAEQAAAWERCRRCFGVEGARLMTSRRVPGVVTVGMRLLVPAGFPAQCTEQEFLSALGHECAHIRRRDSAKNLLYEAAGVLMAFHPVTWMVKARVAETREMICDSLVVERLVEARRYSQSLLQLAERMLLAGAAPVHAIGIFDANALEKRIMQIKAKKRQAGAPARWALMLCGALLLGSAVGMGVWLGTGVQAQAADHTAGNAGKVYRPGEDGVMNPRLIYAPDPEFPKAERKSQGGVCVVGLVVDAQGLPVGVHVVRSLKPDFDANAMTVVRQYRFKPGLLKGKPVAVAIRIEVNYRKY